MESPGIRNFLHYKYNMRTNFNFKDYENYLKALRKNGIHEIEHAGRDISFIQRERFRKAADIIHDLGMKAILYTGVFGTENLSKNPALEKYVQKDNEGNPLSYSGAGRTNAMMCPASPYVDEQTIPHLSNMLENVDLDGIFIDIPWIMRGGCYCSHCSGSREDGADNSFLVRKSLEKIVGSLKTLKPLIQISVNASAPTIHNNRSSGAYIDNLAGIFDEYLTEWNPYRWSQNVNIVTGCIESARKTVNTRLLHATTATDKKGEMYSVDQYEKLFSAILKGGASPRLGISFSIEKLETIGYAWRKAVDRV